MTYYKLVIKFVSFGFIGAMTAFIYFGLFLILNLLLNLDKNISLVVSYLSAVCFHFTMNKNITFKKNKGKTSTQLQRYIIVLFLNFILIFSIMSLLCDYLGIKVIIGYLISNLIGIITGFLANNFWVFKKDH